MFTDTLNRREGFVEHKFFFEKSGKIRSFAKGIVHGGFPKLEFFPYFVFGKKKRFKKLFANTLGRKEGFL